MAICTCGPSCQDPRPCPISLHLPLWEAPFDGLSPGAILTSVLDRLPARNVPHCQVLVDVGVLDRLVKVAGRDGTVAVGQRNFGDAHFLNLH